ncbi:phage tail protein I [uncultured Tateyamaria sp.]|uniref:phage tail protein I n=1 Tax=uncultured Tateyamaria sp. TaxID=455651 RepID=UPI00261067EC|nr:phage tail protein I [uncultured Tateyamaria sp.]
MSEYWPKSELSRITPPQVLDERGSAYLQALNEIIGDQPITAFLVKDAETCPVEALPALIAEYSMEEFIDGDLPEDVQRRILKNAYLLQSLEGYDAGVKLGLSFLGLNANIQQWYAQTPMAAPNTHLVNFSVEEFIFEDGTDYFDDRLITAAWRMINATKRWSQSSEIRLGVSVTSPAYGGAFLHTAIRAEAVADVPPAPLLTAQSGYAAVAHTRLRVEVGG